MGETYAIEWSGGDIDDTVQLWSYGPDGWNMIAAAAAATDGGFNWNTTGLSHGWYCFAAQVNPGDGSAWHASSSPDYIHVVNPANGESIPLWVTNFALMTYGTGAVMSVPAHDQRDFEFAKKYDLPIRMVIRPEDHNLDPETNRLLPAAVLAERWDPVVDGAERIITYCGAGMYGAFDLFVLHLLGYDAALYDGSWEEWAADEDLPIATVPLLAEDEAR